MTDWQQALTAQVAANIEHHRMCTGLTRTALAARCTALGLPTKRPALTALLSGQRRTITLQELVVLAEALNTSVAELIVPLHTGAETITGPGDLQHPLTAAQRLFAIPIDDAATSPYRPYLRYTRAARVFLRANRRLAALSHALATGDTRANNADGRPHPASEILAAEAALARLITAYRDLIAAGIRLPSPDYSWRFLEEERMPAELPVLEHLDLPDAPPVGLYLYRLHTDNLPTSRLISLDGN